MTISYNECAARHFGPWLIDAQWLNAEVAAMRVGVGTGPKKDPDDFWSISEDGVGYVAIQGPMMKGRSKYGGASTLDIRKVLRAMAKNPDVQAVLLHIDSPGGTYAGTAELAADVRALRAKKPVHAHIEDLGASAAYWVAAQAEKVSANATAEIGSIGTVAIIQDTSGKAQAEGIKVHIISTGAYKGAGADGTEITNEQLQYLQGRVNDLNKHFVSAVMAARNRDSETVEQWADGRVWIADRAAQMGLIDFVTSFDGAYNLLLQKIEANKKSTNRAFSAKLNLLGQEIACNSKLDR